MYNRYKGNTGFYETVADIESGRHSRPSSEPESEPGAEPGAEPESEAASRPKPLQAPKAPEAADAREAEPKLTELIPEAQSRIQEKNKPPSISGLLKGGLGGLLDNFNLDSLETEDIILMLVLYLMYRETKDEEYIIILAAMLLL